MHIHKAKIFDIYDIQIKAKTTISLPSDFEIISTKIQDSAYGNGLYIWYKTNNDLPSQDYTFTIVPTGDSVITNDHIHVESMEETRTGLIMHLFYF